MKTRIMVATFAVFLTGTICMAQSQATGDTKSPFTDSQKAQAQQDLKNLADVFGITSDKQTAASKPNTSKTVADVADKALDMVGNAVAQISTTVQNVAPQIWRVMVKQQYANAIGDLVWPTGLVLVAFIFRKTVVKKFSEGEGNNEDKQTLQFISLIVLVGGSLMFFYNLQSSIKILINPEYYAVRDLLQILFKSSGM